MASLIEELDASLRSITEHDPRVLAGGYLGMVLGSGLGDFVESLEDRVEIPYGDLVGFQSTTVAGHHGNLCLSLIHI